MKIIKYFLSVIIIFISVFAFTSCGGGNKIDSEKLPYVFDKETGVLTINFETINYNKESHRPWSDYSEKISKIVVKEGVTNIGSYAFYGCKNVEKVILPETLTTIGDGAFAGCDNLERINIPNSVISIGNINFSTSGKLKYNEDANGKYLGNEDNPYHVLVRIKDISASSYEFNPDTKIILAGAAFGSSLTTIDIPEGIIEIGSSAFANCEKLTKVRLPNSLLSIYNDSFYGVKHFIYKEYNSNLYLGNEDNEYLVCYKYTQRSGFNSFSIDFHPKTQILANHILEYNPMLRQLNLPSTLKVIGKGNFNNVGMLETIDLEDNPYLTLVDGVLYNKDVTKLLLFPSALKNKKWMVPETLKEISENVNFGGSGVKVYFPGTIEEWCKFNFRYNKNNPLISGTLNMKNPKGEYDVVTEMVIPNTVTYIGNYQFYGLSNLTKLTLPDSVVSIGYEAFTNNKELTEIKGGESVAYIMSSAFTNCEKLKEIPDFSNLINLEGGVFYNCTSLEEVNIAESVELIGDAAFSMCISLKSINVKNSNKYYSSKNGILYNKDRSCLIAYPMAKKDTSFTLPKEVKEMKERVFSNNTYLEKVELNNNVKIIPNFAFSNCSNLIEITIPNSVTEIGIQAFFGCKNLKEVHIPKSVEKMGDMAFYSNHEEQVIYCEHDREPNGWHGWHDADEVIWNYKK